MIALGVDPGSTHHGVALIERYNDDRGRLILRAVSIGRKSLPMTTDELKDLIRIYPFDLFVMEMPKGYIHDKFRSKTLLQTSRNAGELVGYARARCETEKQRRVVEMTAEFSRSQLARNAHASDSQVKSSLAIYVKMPRSNKHTRDAAMVAVVALLQEPRFGKIRPDVIELPAQ